MNQNPFEYGTPITHPNQFFGRRTEIKRIQDSIRQMRSISIVGERRVGKSSLLNLMASPELVAEYDLGDDVIFCFVDLQGFEEISQSEFWRWILKELYAELPDALALEIYTVLEKGSFDTLSLRILFEKLAEKKIVFLFDEFESILQNPQFPRSFYGHLRWLSQNCPVAFITATRRELVYHCIDSSTKTSPFFNIFDNLVLRTFKSHECRELIEHYLNGADVHFTESEMTKLIDISGGYPEFLQMACSFLYYAYQDDPSEGSEQECWHYVEDNFRVQLKSHSEYFWDKSEEEEKILLALLALLSKDERHGIPEPKIRKVYPRYKNDLLTLYTRSLVLKVNGGFRLFSQIFAEWILIELTDISKAGEKSLEEWLAAYGKNFVAKGLDKIEDEFRKVNPRYWNLLFKTLLLVREPAPILDIIDKIA
jgi:hypothetical protein